ncbi:S8 family peptidase [Alistipes sp. An66]|uniref:S8 family peptidase n=1 Tax=Alistipes sp. An66 TaxID=1965650 RepID=UPI000B38B21E|nr:S8 family serine peptidase [Alistipes sp. An66]OUN57967.1 peptidase S8 [Alistipes sp. An66]
MQNRKKVLILASILLAACATDPIQESTDTVVTPEETVAAKICNTSQSAIKGMIIAKFNDEVIPVLEQAVAQQAATRSQVTRSGIESVDDIFQNLDVTSFERVFPEAGEREPQTRAAGLHKWYVIYFDEEQDLDEAAEQLASVAEISQIQFSATRCKMYDGKSYPFTGGTPGRTRALVTSDFNDPNLFWQWHYINNADEAVAKTARVGADINAAEAWKMTAGSPEVIVAVVDEGIKYTHPDLAANMWTNPEPSPEYNKEDIHGYNFVDGGPITWDKRETAINGEEVGDSGHGTHVAGTVAAVNNNGIGVAGVAGGTGKNDGVRLMSCQIFSGKNSANDVIVSRAIKYAADHGASILQCSYGYENTDVSNDRMYASRSPLEYEALRFFMSTSNCAALDGGLVFFSAGNEGLSMASYPGAYRECISVTSIAPDYLPAYYTCYGYGCNVAAPGGETVGLSGGEKAGILSTLCSEISGEDYGYMQGTSMSCPHASGVAALGLSYALAKGKHYTREEFISMYLTSVNDLESYLEGTKVTGASLNLEDYRGKMGTGLIDAYQLLMQIEGTPCLKVPTGELQLITLTKYFGGSAQNLTYQGVEISKEDQEKLGMTAAPKMYNGQLMIKCSKPGVAHITVKAVGGGTRPGSETIVGGIEISKKFAIIARDSGAQNGGWL